MPTKIACDNGKIMDYAKLLSTGDALTVPLDPVDELEERCDDGRRVGTQCRRRSSQSHIKRRVRFEDGFLNSFINALSISFKRFQYVVQNCNLLIL